jgi:drug/metabolite transporter (DMT)-like permease
MKKILIFIVFPILLTTFGEFVLKSTINDSQTAVLNAKTPAVITSVIYSIPIPKKAANLLQTTFTTLLFYITNSKIMFSTICILIGGILWLVALSKFELSFLYPFLSINYIFIILGSKFLLHENVGFFRYLSAVLIIIGLIIISQSPYSERNNK